MADRSTAQFVGGIGSIMSTAVVKSFDISKNEVWEAYRQVRANKGAAGADGVSIGGFESDLKGNLYKIWNRMSSGSYMPPAVLAVEIPKSGGGVRVLGVLTVADRIAQTVVANRLSVKVEPVFHPDSYGYRPGRSALDAVAVTRQRCWNKNWVVDVDIAAFFDSVDHRLLLKAVAAHTEDPWVLLYVRRWLSAPLQHADGRIQVRDRGTPQGSLCAAAHKPPYEQRWVMRRAGRLPRVGAVVTSGRCA
jgi:RNA-directed DNA polymerase